MKVKDSYRHWFCWLNLVLSANFLSKNQELASLWMFEGVIFVIFSTDAFLSAFFCSKFSQSIYPLIFKFHIIWTDILTKWFRGSSPLTSHPDEFNPLGLSCYLHNSFESSKLCLSTRPSIWYAEFCVAMVLSQLQIELVETPIPYSIHCRANCNLEFPTTYQLLSAYNPFTIFLIEVQNPFNLITSEAGIVIYKRM